MGAGGKGTSSPDDARTIIHNIFMPKQVASLAIFDQDMTTSKGRSKAQALASRLGRDNAKGDPFLDRKRQLVRDLDYEPIDMYNMQ